MVRGFKCHNVVDTESSVPLDFRVMRIHDHQSPRLREALHWVVVR